MTTIPRTSSDLVHISRAEQRKQRLLELESEQAAEEAEALKMTEEQRQILLKPFTSVKVEFTDLDGLRWSQTALGRFPSFHINTPRLYPNPTSHATSKDNTFVVLTNSDLADFSPEDTIRVSASTTKLRPRYPTVQQTTPPPPSPPLPPHTSEPPTRRPLRGSTGRPRSPLKGLFQSESNNKTPNSSTKPVDMSYFEPSDNSDGNLIPVADNGFVSKHKQRVVSRGRRKLVGPPGLVPLDSLESQTTSSPMIPHSLDRRASSPDLLSTSTSFPLKSTLLQTPPPSPILSKPPLIVHSFISEPPPPRQIPHSPKQARFRLHSILNGNIPPKPLPFPVDLDTTPSPFLLSSATFGQYPRDTGEDDDDDTPTTSPTSETAEHWIR